MRCTIVNSRVDAGFETEKNHKKLYFFKKKLAIFGYIISESAWKF